MISVHQVRAAVCVVSLLVSAAECRAQGAAAQPQMVSVEGRLMRALVGGLAERKAGQPVLILEAGAGGGLDEWSPIFSDLIRLAPALAYDRRGLGRSEADTQPQNYRRVAQSLHALLSALEIPPPYVLVGHSFGAMYIRGFADMFPAEVVGYVYLDAFNFDGTREEKAAAFPEAERDQTLAPPVFPPVPPATSAGVRAEIDFIKAEMLIVGAEGRTLGQRPGVPVAVVVAAPPDRLRHPGEILMRLEIKHQAEWALQSSNGLLIASGDTGHNVPRDAPELVLLAVRHVLRNIPGSTK